MTLPVAPSEARKLDPSAFREAFAKFQHLVQVNDKGNPFTTFNEGRVAVEEGYKPRLRDYARSLLAPESWTEAQIGSGEILNRVIDAIEIQDSRGDRTNNLVFWQNRFGHANRDHRTLLEAVNDKRSRREFEEALFGLYAGRTDEGLTFSRLADLTGAKYPLMAYLHFLKDMDRFMPIHPTGFDAAFRDLGVDLVTLRNCSWDNYNQYNAVLEEVRDALTMATGLPGLRLVDAHSFCWLLVQFKDLDPEDDHPSKTKGFDPGRILGARERSIADLKYSIMDVAKRSNGQVEVRNVQLKNKELRMSPDELDAFIRERLELQGDRCALTGIPFQFNGAGDDVNLRPSPDRIDSDGHYERDNLQLVCRFVNMWKGAEDDGEFRRLLSLVRGGALP